MSREIRRVPEEWSHPRKSYTTEHDYVQLSDDYISSLEYWKKDVEMFIKHMTEVIETGKTNIYGKEYATPKAVYEYINEDETEFVPPNINEYMPGGTWYQLFQTVGEGSPLSPPFETKKELSSWLGVNKDYWGHEWTTEQAEAMVEKEFAMSGVFTNGKFYSSEESVLL